MTDAALNHDEAGLIAVVQSALAMAADRKLMMSASAWESGGHVVTAANGRAEKITATHALRLSLTVFDEGRRGSASTGDLSPNAVRQALDHAVLLARHGGADPDAGLPAADLLAWDSPIPDVYRPSGLDADAVVERACAVEAGARDAGELLVETTGLETGEARMALGNSHGFARAWSRSWTAGWASLAAGPAGDRQSASWSEQACALADLPAPEAIGAEAARRGLALVGARPITPRQCPVLFEAPIAASLVGELIGGLSGAAQVRKASWLADAMGRRILPDHVSLAEDPFRAGGMASRPYDGDGIAGSRRDVIADGTIAGYFLDAYGARRLGMAPTGSGEGPGNLLFASSLTEAADDLPAMLRRLGTGLLVTGLSGQGVNPITGDYSREAKGFWVEHGVIAHPVHGVTVAGTLPTMFEGLVAIGADVRRSDAVSTGSILIDAMRVSG